MKPLLLIAAVVLSGCINADEVEPPADLKEWRHNSHRGLEFTPLTMPNHTCIATYNGGIFCAPKTPAPKSEVE